MITNAADMLQALKTERFRGIVLYAGPSQIDGQPVVAIINRITARSSNAKTGHMVQSFIIRSDVHPMAALANGADQSVCGDCKHRPLLHKAAGAARCYVQVAKSVASVWNAFRNGRYAMPGTDYDVRILPELFRGLAFRIGTYGDPTAIPFQCWRAATLHAAFVNGYSHQWQDRRFAAFKLLCMASADTESERDAAHAAGWRTFRVRDSAAPLTRGVEVMCPASKEAGFKTDCASCKACGGLSAKARISIAIAPHGNGARPLAIAA